MSPQPCAWLTRCHLSCQPRVTTAMCVVDSVSPFLSTSCHHSHVRPTQQSVYRYTFRILLLRHHFIKQTREFIATDVDHVVIYLNHYRATLIHLVRETKVEIGGKVFMWGGLDFRTQQLQVCYLLQMDGRFAVIRHSTGM